MVPYGSPTDKIIKFMSAETIKWRLVMGSSRHAAELTEILKTILFTLYQLALQKSRRFIRTLAGLTLVLILIVIMPNRLLENKLRTRQQRISKKNALHNETNCMVRTQCYFHSEQMNELRIQWSKL